MAVREFVLSVMALGGVCALGAVVPSTPPLLTYPLVQNIDGAAAPPPGAAAAATPVPPVAMAETKAANVAPVIKAAARRSAERVKPVEKETVTAEPAVASEIAAAPAHVELASAPATVEPAVAEIADAAPPA